MSLAKETENDFSFNKYCGGVNSCSVPGTLCIIIYHI